MTPKPVLAQTDAPHLAGLSDATCVLCNGSGAIGYYGTAPCKCVWRAVFRQCLHQYRKCHVEGALLGREFCADFELIARRELKPEQWRLFRMSTVLGLSELSCSVRLGLNRPTYYSMSYRIAEKCGKAYAETQPYPLWPFSKYFGGAR
jgi:hypothetical protein